MFGREIEDIFVWVVSHWVQEPTLLTEFWARLCRGQKDWCDLHLRRDSEGNYSHSRIRLIRFKNRFWRRKRAMSIPLIMRRLHCIMDSSRSKCSDICISVHLICRKKVPKSENCYVLWWQFLGITILHNMYCNRRCQPCAPYFSLLLFSVFRFTWYVDLSEALNLRSQ